MRARGGVARGGLVERGGGQAAACALEGDGQEVEADEDPEVELGGDEGVGAPPDSDELELDVVEAGAEEARGYGGVG